MKVTKGARKPKDGKRPAVLYSAVAARARVARRRDRAAARCACSSTTTARNGTALGTDGQPVEGVSSRELTKLVDTRELWFILDRQPRRVRLHVHAREPAVAQEPARQRRRRRDHRDRRRRPEPQLPDALALRRRGLEQRALVRDLPRHRAGLRAGDAGVPVADEPRAFHVTTRTTTPSGSCCCGRPAGRSTRARRTSRS